MSVIIKVSRTPVWMETLGDWSWPGSSGAAAAEMLPPPWVPAFPPRREVATDPSVAGASARGARTRRLVLGVLLASLAAVCVALAAQGRLGLERMVGIAPARSATQLSSAADSSALAPLPTLRLVSSDANGSSIDEASYTSPALRGNGSFLVYLPRGYAESTRRYPVLYLLHGDDQLDTAFLQVGLQGELDSLIASHQIEPLIAVMIQGGRGSNNWLGPYENYILEVQQLIDRMLPTVAARDARAIAGDSMGGFGAMNVALGNPYRFSVVESWLGFFNGLNGRLRADAPIISHLGLSAFVYGAASDSIANPAENEPFAAALNASGAHATGLVYPGGHTLETVAAHLGTMLVFAGRKLNAAQAASAAPLNTRSHGHATS